jgi:hypothetical protein
MIRFFLDFILNISSSEILKKGWAFALSWGHSLANVLSYYKYPLATALEVRIPLGLLVLKIFSCNGNPLAN